jgi:Mrp family chromosome partitioning ATPase
LLPSLNVLAARAAMPASSSLEELGMVERTMRRLPELIREAGVASELVILDTPALSEFGDGLRILPSADCVVLVVRLRRTQRSALQRCGELLSRAGRTPVGMVLTGPGRKRRHPPELSPLGGIAGLQSASVPDEERAEATAVNR